MQDELDSYTKQVYEKTKAKLEKLKPARGGFGEAGVKINTGPVALGQWFLLSGQWNLPATGPVGL